MKRPEFNEEWFNPNAELPYGVSTEEIKTTIEEFYDFYSDLNEFLMREGHGRIETILRANNALSDFIGNAATEELAQASDDLVINQKPDGFPDVLPPVRTRNTRRATTTFTTATRESRRSARSRTAAGRLTTTNRHGSSSFDTSVATLMTPLRK